MTLASLHAYRAFTSKNGVKLLTAPVGAMAFLDAYTDERQEIINPL